MLSFITPRVNDRIILLVFPVLFITALLFPPLLLLIPAAELSALLLFPEAPPPVFARALSSAVRLPGRRSPPLAV